MMAVIATVADAPGLTVSERTTETVLVQLRDLACRPLPAVVEAAGKSHKPTMWSLHLGGVIEEDADFMMEVRPQVRRMGACYIGPELCNTMTAPVSPKDRLLKAEMVETLLYRCVA